MVTYPSMSLFLKFEITPQGFKRDKSGRKEKSETSYILKITIVREITNKLFSRSFWQKYTERLKHRGSLYGVHWASHLLYDTGGLIQYTFKLMRLYGGY